MTELQARFDPSGSLFLGADKTGNSVTIQTERHAITIAGSQAGKGVGVIVPNLLRWPHNALVIDPKCEAATLTAKARTDAGRPSYVFDPFGKASVPDELRVTINPLDRININSFTVTEDIGVIADGVVRRMDTSDDASYWDGGARTLIAGLIAYVLLYLPKEEQNLLSVRRILRDEALLEIVYGEMSKEERLGGLCQSAANRIKAKEGNYFISNAQDQTEWLDSEAMRKALVTTNFDLGRLKWGNASLYLALPSKYLKQHGNFLRLFVRTAIDVMQEERDNKIRCNDCLFFLDEMHTLGRIDEIAESAGLMAGYGLKLWPIFQNVGQITKLYGQEGVGTFLGSSDLHQFFGNMDSETLNLISQKVGNYTVADLPPEPVPEVSPQIDELERKFAEERDVWWRQADPNIMGMYQRHIELWEQYDRQAYLELLNQFKTDASRILGKPRVTPDKIALKIQKPPKGPSEYSICFLHGGKSSTIRLWPYYVNKMPDLTPPPPQKSHGISPSQPSVQKSGSSGGFWKWLFG